MNENIVQTRVVPVASDLIAPVRKAFDQAYAGVGKLPDELLSMKGMSGTKYRLFINNLINKLLRPRYLEVGSWTGSTLCSAINGNAVEAIAIDNWSEFDGPKDEFKANVAKFKTPEAKVGFLESDYKDVDFTKLGKFNVYFFDGPHDDKNQYDGIVIAQPALEDTFVLVVDDWNWSRVRQATLSAIADLQLSLLFGLEIRTTLTDENWIMKDEPTDWHNGYLIGVYQQKGT